MTRSFGVSVIVPVYNGADVLPTTIAKLTDYLARKFANYELILIDDGSTDESQALIRATAAKNQNIRFFVHDFNKGQQQTLADGFLAAKNEIAITVDADLPCELGDLERIAHLAHSGTDLALGQRARNLNRIWWRNLGSRMANWAFRALYPFKISDFGCGIAAVRRSLIERFRTSDRPVRLIKLDLLYLAKNYAELEIHVPVTLSTGKSSYSFSKLLKLFWTVLTYRLQ